MIFEIVYYIGVPERARRFCLARKLLALPFFKKVAKNPYRKLTSNPTSLFLLAQKGAKEKALQKENAVFMGRCPKPHSFFEKNETKNF